MRHPSRRDLLRLGGVATVGAATPGLAGCVGVDRSTLRFMYWGSSFEQDAVEKMLAAFEKQHQKASVNPMYIPREYQTKVNTLVAAEKFPDVLYLGGPQAYQLAEKGWLVDVSRYFDRYPELAERLPQTYFWWDEGKTFGTQTANEISLLWYNKKLLRKAGIDSPPATAADALPWDDLVEMADRLTLDNEGRRPSERGFDDTHVRQFGLSIDLVRWWYPLVRSNGGDIVDESGTTCTLNSRACAEVFQRLQDLIYEHRVAPSPAQLGSAPNTTVQLQTRRTAMAVDGQWVLLDMAQSDLDYGIGVLPRFQEPITMSEGGASVISARSRRPEQALELYLFHTDPRHVDLFASGLWMPLQKRYYTEPDLIASWTDNDAHPPEYRTAVVDYALKHSVTTFVQRLRNMQQISEVLTPGLQRISTGEEEVRTVLDDLQDQIQPLLEGWYPSSPL